MNVTQAVQTISNDFAQQQGPFEDVDFPEERLLAEIPQNGSMEDTLTLVSMFSTFDYNRNASQLVDNIINLYNEAWWTFNPADAQKNEDDLSDLMAEIGFRYPNRDATAWSKNCDILMDNYHGYWHELIMTAGCDAPTLVEQLDDDGFSCLKGVKIAPMYARIVNDEVTPLSNVWDLEIPVDTHIRRLSKDLFQMPEASDDLIRKEWRGLSVEADIDRQVVDGALWHIGNKWDDWGETYWESLK